VVISQPVDKVIKEACMGISLRYEINFLEIGTDEDHVHFLVQSVPMKSVTEIVTTIKSLVAKEVFKRAPEVKRKLWGGEFWGSGYFANTVGQHGSEKTIANYVRGQGKEKEYVQIHSEQLKLF
jgi:REP element-mobilizing transposase RayT